MYSVTTSPAIGDPPPASLIAVDASESDHAAVVPARARDVTMVPRTPVFALDNTNRFVMLVYPDLLAVMSI